MKIYNIVNEEWKLIKFVINFIYDKVDRNDRRRFVSYLGYVIIYLEISINIFFRYFLLLFWSK